MSACPTVPLTPLERRVAAVVARLGPHATERRVAEALGRAPQAVVDVWHALRSRGLPLPPPPTAAGLPARRAVARARAPARAAEPDPRWRAAVGRRIAAARRKKARGDEPDPWYAEAPDPVLALEPAEACRAMLVEWRGVTP